MTLFLGLEWFSIALYILCAMDTHREASLEAGLKYLIVGAFGSSILLFGSALVYGATGALGFSEIAAANAGDDSSAPRRARDADRRARLQGLGGAVPHVDAGRLPGCADVGDGVHVGGDEGGRSRPDAPAPRRRLPGAVEHLWTIAIAVIASPRSRSATSPRSCSGTQAPARLLVGLARRLHADRDRREQRARRPRAPLLPDPLRRDVDRLVRGRRGARARAAGAGDAREPRRARLGAAVPRRVDVGLHARLHGHAASPAA